jgi:hypothetical protein
MVNTIINNTRLRCVGLKIPPKYAARRQAESVPIIFRRDTKITAISQDHTFITATIEQRQILVGTSRLVLIFSAKDMQLRQRTVTDPQGDETMGCRLQS